MFIYSDYIQVIVYTCTYTCNVSSFEEIWISLYLTFCTFLYIINTECKNVNISIHFVHAYTYTCTYIIILISFSLIGNAVRIEIENLCLSIFLSYWILRRSCLKWRQNLRRSQQGSTVLRQQEKNVSKNSGQLRPNYRNFSKPGEQWGCFSYIVGGKGFCKINWIL